MQVHGRIRRYTSPDENAFFPDDVPPLVLPPITYEQARTWCRVGWGVWCGVCAVVVGRWVWVCGR